MNRITSRVLPLVALAGAMFLAACQNGAVVTPSQQTVAEVDGVLAVAAGLSVGNPGATKVTTDLTNAWLSYQDSHNKPALQRALAAAVAAEATMPAPYAGYIAAAVAGINAYVAAGGAV